MKLLDRVIHCNPHIHLPDWEERMTARRIGPVWDWRWPFGRKYMSVEGCRCKRPGCGEFKIARKFRDI